MGSLRNIRKKIYTPGLFNRERLYWYIRQIGYLERDYNSEETQTDDGKKEVFVFYDANRYLRLYINPENGRMNVASYDWKLGVRAEKWLDWVSQNHLEDNISEILDSLEQKIRDQQNGIFKKS